MRLIGILLSVLMIGVGGYFFLQDKTYTLKFTESQLRDRMEEQLPFSERYLLLFDVTLQNPRVDLVDGSDKIAGGLDVAVNIGLGNGGGIQVNGALDVLGGVRYAPEEGAFYLTDPKLETLRFQDVPERYSNRANEAISLALKAFYRDRPIYRLAEDDLREATAKMVLRDVTIKDETLQVTLGLAEKQE